jgi:aminotransferase EvaB
MEAAGTTPILVDIDPVTYNAPACSLQVHLYGLAEDAHAAHVEDCAHSMGARVNGKLAGTMGRCGALSFYPSKIMGACGDGGAIITNDKEIADACRMIRHYGIDKANGDIKGRGQNSRLSELQAAYLRIKLGMVYNWIVRRQDIAARYDEELRGCVTVPVGQYAGTVEHVHHVYVIQYEERDRLRAALHARGIGSMVHYDRAIHQYTRWAEHGWRVALPNAERLAARCLSLPLYPFMRDDEVDAVIAAVKENT